MSGSGSSAGLGVPSEVKIQVQLQPGWANEKAFKVAASKRSRGASSEGRLNTATTTTTDTGTGTSLTNSRQGSVDGVMQRCGLCSIISSLLRRAMCVGSRRGSGESYYQELAETNVSTTIYLSKLFNYCYIFYGYLFDYIVFSNIFL